MARALAFAFVICLAPNAARATPDGTVSQFGFGYCPPPIVPSCIERYAQGPREPGLSTCGRDVLRFTRTLGAYRACLTRESERAIGTGNAAIARFRCLSQHGTDCR